MKHLQNWRLPISPQKAPNGALIVALIGLASTGCAAGTEDQSTAQPQVSASNEPAIAPIDPSVGPSATPPEPSPNEAANTDTGDGTDTEGPGENEATTPAASETTNQPPRGWRRDGRPVWWLDAPQRDESRVAVCAEALGPDVLSARRAAVRAGRTAMARLFGAEATDAQVIAAAVRPLGVGEPSQNAARFVGFVLMSLKVGDTPSTPPGK